MASRKRSAAAKRRARQVKAAIVRPAEALSLEHGIWAVHRDLLGGWNNGAPLMSLPAVNGAGQGDRKHLGRWKRTYDN